MEDLDESTTAGEEGRSYSELVKHVNAISKPLAGKKLTKNLYRITKKATKVKCARRGVKEVTKALRKGQKGIVILAGDVTPIDVYSHLPVTCEEKNVPYCYVPSRLDLGLACNSKRPTCAVMVQLNDDFKEKYDKCCAEVNSLPMPF